MGYGGQSTRYCSQTGVYDVVRLVVPVVCELVSTANERRLQETVLLVVTLFGTRRFCYSRFDC